MVSKLAVPIVAAFILSRQEGDESPATIVDRLTQHSSPPT